MSKRPLSLIEVIITISVLSVLSSVFAFSLLPLYHSYRFQMQYHSLYHLARQLQIDALMYRSQMELIFYQHQGRWHAKSSTEEKIVKTYDLTLSYIDHIEFASGFHNPLQVTFYADGRAYPKDTLIFSSAQDKKFLNFKSPCLIQSQNTPAQTLSSEVKERLRKKANL